MAWETALDADTAIADAWASQQPQIANRSQSRSRDTSSGEVSALVVPLVAGVRTVGLVALETDTPGAYPPHVVATVVALAAPAALRLEAALLFDEVRSLATTEERQRLAREIHDGVAQELVMVGYGIDNALAALPDAEEAAEAAEELRTLRGEVTRVITELRLRLFELRSEVDRHGGLTAAIAEYAGPSAPRRACGCTCRWTSRPPGCRPRSRRSCCGSPRRRSRTPASTPVPRISGSPARSTPRTHRLRVSDDGKGIADPEPDGRYGLAIMAERAERIRGRLEITPRVPNGTTVAVVLGTAPRRGSV